MKTFEFTFVVEDADPHSDDFEDRFFEAGCEDATLVLMHGAVAACFCREDESYSDAVLSAYDNILKTGSRVARFEPDFLVSASEIASRAGLSRAAVSNYEHNKRCADFPRPLMRVTTSSPLWDWVEVSTWLYCQGKIDEEVCRHAQVSRIINSNVQKKGGYRKACEDVKGALAQPITA